MNKVILIGRLTKDPDIRNTQSGATVAHYTLAVDRPKREGEEQSADFIPCTCFGKSAEFAEKWLRKGIKIVVVGRIQTGSYTDRDGKKVFTWGVIVENQEFVESKAANQSQRQAAPASPQDAFQPIPDDLSDSGLPFN